MNKVLIGPTVQGEELSMISRALVGKSKSDTEVCIRRETYLDMRKTREYKKENSLVEADTFPTIFGYRFSLYNEPAFNDLDESIKEVFQ